jgi:hypothetical protein
VGNVHPFELVAIHALPNIAKKSDRSVHSTEFHSADRYQIAQFLVLVESEFE